MKTSLVALLVCVALACAAPNPLVKNNRNVVNDILTETFGMGPVLSILQTVNLDLYNNFIGKAMFISFTGDWLIEKTRPVFEQLVKDLVNHAYMATEYVSQAVIDLQKLMFNSGKRNVVFNMFMDTFGLSSVANQIQTVNSDLLQEFFAASFFVLYADQEIMQQAQLIYQNLVSQLLNHAGTADELVSQAIVQLSSLLNKKSNKSHNDNVVKYILTETFGMGSVLSILQTVENSLYIKFTGLAMYISFTGDWLLELTLPIFEQLVKDLANHAYMANEYVSQAVIDINTIIIETRKI